ncbi:hypothetical protein PSQ19_05605 [Devosia algicola]|uniref:Beta-ketoacyl synthase N-terminal domain-containing protein n=1 Tax=Devosia algicola TaxID=3026418 RepID=A0ABY7YRB6_9HYPH|nr:hypothetical protein [Devosia algicola]WDR03564.1 hypothetical protein PSQ19_05605 [Devosia algicola]
MHAADDISVMETLESLPDIIRTARSFAPGVAIRLGPATIGAPPAFYAARPADNPARVRMPTAASDPRQRGLFAAAFSLGYAATVAALDLDAMTLGCCDGPAAINEGTTSFPLAFVVAGLSKLAGRPRHRLEVAGAGFAALAAHGDEGLELWLANLTGDPITIGTSGASFHQVQLLDATALSRSDPMHIPVQPYEGGLVTLDTYGVCRLIG